MRIVLRAAADRDLDGIFDYSVEAFGGDRAAAYLKTIDAAFARLVDYPELGQLFSERPGVRILGVEEHRVIYRVAPGKIIVVRVLHKRMDVER